MVDHSKDFEDREGDSNDLTSLHLQRARGGEEASLSWIVAHFTPFLRMQAGYRLQGEMRRLHDPEDLVDEVWMSALPRIPDLEARDGHLTPVLLKFLATTLLNRINNHLTRYLRTEARRVRSSSSSGSDGTRVSTEYAALMTSVLGSVARNEARALLHEALEGLAPAERELLVLRGIEQHSNQDVARRLGVEPSTLTRRYQRVLDRLRTQLPGSIFDDLPS